MMVRGISLLLPVVLGFAALGCKAKSDSPAPSPSASALPPLRASSWLEALPVPGFLPASVSAPLGARTQLPLIIALHGDADRPEWHCGSYRYASAGRALVLCPRGLAGAGDRFTVGTAEQTTRELRAALPALKKRFGDHVARGSVVLAAIGPSVAQAIEIAREEPSFFARLILVGGSLHAMTLPTITRYGQLGGKKVWFICTRAGCDADVESRVTALRRSGVDARVHRLERAYGLDGDTAELLRKDWAWLVHGDARWP